MTAAAKHSSGKTDFLVIVNTAYAHALVDYEILYRLNQRKDLKVRGAEVCVCGGREYIYSKA